MQVDIYIREQNGTREIRIPWLPDEIKVGGGEVETASYKIMYRGEVAIPTGTDLTTYGWESIWPGQYRTDKSLQHGDWQDPKIYHKIMESWAKNGTILNLMVTGYPINDTVFVKEYECTAAGGFGDISYTVKFAEKRDLTITTTGTSEPTSAEESQPEPERPAPNTTDYTIKSGDNLWTIAQHLMGDGKKWQVLYEANADIIESTAKERGRESSANGHWIYPGITIKIPQ